MPYLVASKTYGTVSPDRQKEMSGLEFVQGLVEGSLPLNMIAQTLGYDVTEVENGRVVVTGQPNQNHLNPYGTIHGGLTATLLDSCMGLAVQSTLEKGFAQTTKHSASSHFSPADRQVNGCNVVCADGTSGGRPLDAG